jgi:DNA-directed RNA polymerase subunit RPC12/RpoP
LDMGILESTDVAGLGDALRLLGKRIPSGKIPVFPGVEIDTNGDCLVWPDRWRPFVEPAWITPTGAMFARFIELWAEDDPDEICRFAKKWGRLGVDEKGILTGGFPQPIGKGRRDREPLEAWRYFSRRANAVLAIAANIRQGRLGRPEDWAALSSLSSKIPPALWNALRRYVDSSYFEMLADRGFNLFLTGQPIKTQAFFLSAEIMLWMRITGLGFAFIESQPKGSGWHIEVDYNGSLLAAMALHLALNASGHEALYVCSGCGRPYIRSNKSPKPGESNFCKSCGRAESLRHADKRRRERIQEARKLHAIDVPMKEIAKRLGVRSPATVRRWIEKGK